METSRFEDSGRMSQNHTWAMHATSFSYRMRPEAGITNKGFCTKCLINFSKSVQYFFPGSFHFITHNLISEMILVLFECMYYITDIW